MLDGLRPTVEESWNASLVELMRECWDVSPSKRPTFSEIELRLRAVIAELAEGDEGEAQTRAAAAATSAATEMQ